MRARTYALSSRTARRSQRVCDRTCECQAHPVTFSVRFQTDASPSASSTPCPRFFSAMCCQLRQLFAWKWTLRNAGSRDILYVCGVNVFVMVVDCNHSVHASADFLCSALPLPITVPHTCSTAQLCKYGRAFHAISFSADLLPSRFLELRQLKLEALLMTRACGSTSRIHRKCFPPKLRLWNNGCVDFDCGHSQVTKAWCYFSESRSGEHSGLAGSSSDHFHPTVE
jgi:hypothetical protein